VLRILDLFSGIGGFSLGLERTGGFETVAFCEIEPFCRKVLRKHWPDVPIYEDVRELTAERLGADGIAVDVICGGFPCQDISHAGKGAGIEGERSGLWSEYARLIGELRPGYVIVENVAALLGRGLERVLGDLAALGYDAEWHCIPAAYVGAPHRRDRVWIVAHPNGEPLRGDGCPGDVRAQGSMQGEADQRQWFWADASAGRSSADVADATRLQPGRSKQWSEWQRAGKGCEPVSMADADQPRLEGWNGASVPQRAGECTARTSSASVADAQGSGRRAGRSRRSAGVGEGIRQQPLSDPDIFAPIGSAIAWQECDPWLPEPDVGRVAHGIPSRVDRLKGLGNAVVPQIPELIGRAILEAEAA
jgi:DNA (cytosine-5)-methyltransferase 1